MSDLVALYKTKIDALKSQLADSQIYLNMIVHDMRSPTHAIKLGLEATLDQIGTGASLLNKQLEQHSENGRLRVLIKDLKD